MFLLNCSLYITTSCDVMYIKYILNYWSVCLYHDIHSKKKVIYFEQGLIVRGGFLSVPR